MYKIIGDVHSRSTALKKALEENVEYLPVFLGDILDGKKHNCESFLTLRDLATIALINKSNSVIILGNHDQNLLQETVFSKKTINTNQRLKQYDSFKVFKQILKSAFNYYSFEIKGIRYDLAHAVPFYTATDLEKVYGQKIENKRYKWFENYKAEKNIFKICGHYHQLILTESYCILDGDSNAEECLPVLLIDNNNNKTLLKYYD
jgi:predicted phosphodiesterase